MRIGTGAWASCLGRCCCFGCCSCCCVIPGGKAPGCSAKLLPKASPAEKGLLMLLLKDLWAQDLPVGGEVSVGRGQLQGVCATIVDRQMVAHVSPQLVAVCARRITHDVRHETSSTAVPFRRITLTKALAQELLSRSREIPDSFRHFLHQINP